MSKKLFLLLSLCLFGLSAIQAQSSSSVRLPVGANSGWPPDSIFDQIKLSVLRQPAGTLASYDFDIQKGLLVIYIRNGTQGTIVNMVYEIESSYNAVGRGSMQAGSYALSFPVPAKRGFNTYRVEIELKDGGAQLTAHARAN